MSWTRIASVDELSVGAMKQVTVEDEDIALYHLEDGFYATSDACSHASQPLSKGSLTGHVVACPKHGGKFDIHTGQAVAFPCVIPIQVYQVEVRGTEVWLDF
ncbi:MAG: (2Fe-2S)-binding protein [Alicyclobacillus sp. RIFOXYA1_FULL_53_8]|nr:MAG: (2Fe-2S)-binding protein [Alicyclobacillus sp. RIFOXYA1_FULL_53_8]